MTNEEKLKFIHDNYINIRAAELVPADEKLGLLRKWAEEKMAFVPERLYKYRECNKNNLNALRNRTAWFSCPSTWNDPIDVTVFYDLEKDRKILLDRMDDIVTKMAFTIISQHIESFCEQKKLVTVDQIKEVYYGVFQKDRSLTPKKIAKYLIPLAGEKNARQIASDSQKVLAQVYTPQYKKQIFDKLEKMLKFNNIRNEMLMYSLSETYENDHQWAVYAKDGKGFCIGHRINPQTVEEWDMISDLLPIYYGEKRPLMLTEVLDEMMECALEPAALQDIVNQKSESTYISLNTKKPQWSGEEEWRFAIKKERVESNAIPFDFAESIYLGEKVSKKWKKDLLDIASEQGLTVYQRKLDSTKSKWVYEKINLC